MAALKRMSPDEFRKLLEFLAHAADDALTLLRIHSGTLYKARAAGKMVCEAIKVKCYCAFSTTSISIGIFVGTSSRPSWSRKASLVACFLSSEEIFPGGHANEN